MYGDGVGGAGFAGWGGVGWGRGRVSIDGRLHVSVSVWSYILRLAGLYKYFATGIIPCENDGTGQGNFDLVIVL